MTPLTNQVSNRETEWFGIGLRDLLDQLNRSNVGLWVWDVLTNRMYWSSSCRRLFGIPEEEPLSYQRFLDALQSDDRQHVQEAIQSKLESTLDTDYEIEYRIVLPDGRERWIQAKGSVTVAAGISVRMAGIAIDITQRKQSEALICYEQARLQAVLEQLPHGVVFADAPDGRLVLVNDKVEKILGHHFIASEGFQQYDAYKGFHPNGRRYAPGEWPLARSIQSGEVVTREEVRYERPDGTHVYIEVSSTPIRDASGQISGGVVIFADMTERKRVDEALRERENRLGLALAAGQMGTWDVDLQSGQSTWDARLVQLLDYADHIAPSEAAFLERVHPDDRMRVQNGIRLANIEASDLEHEFRIVRSDGDVRWLVSKGMVLKDDDGHAKRVVGISYDITEHKQNEERLRSFAQQLELRVDERTQELVTSQTRLRALASELNLAEQRERKRLAAELHDHLQQLLVLSKLKLSQGKRSASVPSCLKVMEQVDHVLTEALTYTRTLVAELSPPVLHDHGLASALKWLGDYMKTKYDMAVTVTVPPQGEPNLPEEQAGLLLQSVRELLINSRKHAGTNQAAVTMVQQGSMLRIEVRDRGKGFDMAEVETPTELSSKFGLFSIGERMRVIGGMLNIESGAGVGTRAVIELPLAAASKGTESVRHSDKAQGQRVPSPESGVVAVLLVDDHAMMRQGLRSVLEAYQDVAVIAEAANGKEAIDLAERFRPRVVIMDINMPTMNGIDATQYLTSHYPDMAVIGLSVNADRENRAAMKRAGAALLLTKEAAVEQLYMAIQHVVQSTGQQTHPAH